MKTKNNNLIDFHSHILPQVDDGSSSLEQSLAMLRKEAEQGIRQVVATPHFYARHDTPERFLARRDAAAERLRTVCSRDLPQIILGAEVAYYSGMSESDILPAFCIGDSRYLLVELPGPPWSSGVLEELAAIRSRQGLTPIVAHVDRYLMPLQTERMLRRLAELPVLLQVNTSWFLQKHTARTALRQLKLGRIHLLGSDCHNLDSRPPNLGQAAAEISRRLGGEALDWLVQQQNRIILATINL